MPATSTPKNFGTGTIQNLINMVKAGDTIILPKGVYEEQTLLINKAISIVGEDSKSTIINLHPQWVPTGGLHLNNGGVAQDYGYEPAIKITANNASLSGVTVNNNSSSLFVTGNRNKITDSILEIPVSLIGSQNNVSFNSVTQGISSYGHYNEIYNNTIADTFGAAINLEEGGNFVFNNTISNCTYGVSVLGTSSSNNVFSNIITNNEGGIGFMVRETTILFIIIMLPIMGLELC